MVTKDNISVMTWLRKYVKLITSFLAVNFIFSLLAPTATYALTAGPTAPEFSSFEPVDTTDMVNMLTGDFVYNTPLFELPGPAGGYPISLSYHAGIEPDVEASWVGLGWTLNPGAITRFVNGYPDDHYDVKNVRRDFWSGGEYTQYEVGASYGIANFATVSSSLVFANDSYRGFGVGMNNSIGLVKNFGNVKLGIGASVSKSPFGGITAGVSTTAGVGIGIGESLKLNIGSGISLNSSTGLNAGLNGGVSYQSPKAVEGENGFKNSSYSLLGASLSSNSSAPSFSVGGASASVYNSRSGNVTYASQGLNFSVDVPTPIAGLNIRLGRKAYRYFTDEKEEVSTYGSLYKSNFLTAHNYQFNRRAEDVYDISDPVKALDDDYKLLGDLAGTYISDDTYQISGQGISGQIKPYHYLAYVNRQNELINGGADFKSKNYHLGGISDAQRPEFRFVGDFSNRHEYLIPDFFHDVTDPSNPLAFDFNQGFTRSGIGYNSGFGENGLIGSKSIRYLTNEEFGTAYYEELGNRFLETSSSGFNRSTKPAKQIGGFVVTNESGVNYHYSLPVYSLKEHIYSEKINDEGETDKSFNHLTKEEPYAYTWLLTAVTGPDFIDRGGEGNAPNGMLDDEDWGYWVEFDYGLWTEDYQWRNPSVGFHRDLDNDFQTFSIGKKEIYYLDAIRTKTHSALFIKDLRLDAKGTTSDGHIVTATSGNADVKLDKGGFIPKRHYITQAPDYPEASLKLDNIVLVQNSDISSVDKTLSVQENITHHIDRGIQGIPVTIEVPVLNYDNVLDVYDEELANYRNHALRTIDFETDYSLVKGTPNSFSNNDFYHLANVSLNPEAYENDGKLTLKALTYGGKQGESIIPPTRFSYDKNPIYKKDARDLWGFYKSDYVDGDWRNENLKRITTKTSAAEVDAWSLTGIHGPLGKEIHIGYESDDYSESVLVKNRAFLLEEITPNGDDEIVLGVRDSEIDLTEVFSIGEEVYPTIAFGYFVTERCANEEVPETEPVFDITNCSEHNDKGIITDIIGNTITINSPNLSKFLSHRISENSGTCFYEEIRRPLGGNLSFDNDGRVCGGGIRVNSVSTMDALTGITNRTVYDYDEPGTGRSSGVTSYEPIVFDLVSETLPDDLQYLMKKELYKEFSDLLSKSSEVPGPGVMYEWVTMREEIEENGVVEKVPAYTTYNFQVFNESFLNYESSSEASESIIGNNRVKSNQVHLHDVTAAIGSLRSVTSFDGNDKPMATTINHYLVDELLEENDLIEGYLMSLARYKSQGVLAETFANARIIKNEPTDDYDQDYIGVITQKVKYPSIQTGQTTIDHRSGISTSSKNLAFDFYSGQPTVTYQEDQFDNKYAQVAIPAYRFHNGINGPTWSGMGPADQSVINKNMLVQEGASFSFKLQDDFEPFVDSFKDKIDGIIGGQLQTWDDQMEVIVPGGRFSTSSEQLGIYRKQRSYGYIGNGLAIQPDGTFQWSGDYSDFMSRMTTIQSDNRPDLTEGWQLKSHITFYDAYSHALEVKDINGNFAATKFDLKQEQIVATASFSNYDQFAYSGFEGDDWSTELGGGLTLASYHSRIEKGRSGYEQPHTGNYSLMLNSDDEGLRYVIPDQGNGQPEEQDMSYLVSLWATLPNGLKITYKNGAGPIQVAPSLPVEGANGWYLHKAMVTVPAGAGDLELSLRCQADEIQIDDFRVHPVGSSMTSYVYNQWGELSDILDANNFYTHYEYDSHGRLHSVTQETLKYGPVKTAETLIHYSRN